jgi:hypothetical protein
MDKQILDFDVPGPWLAELKNDILMSLPVIIAHQQGCQSKNNACKLNSKLL